MKLPEDDRDYLLKGTNPDGEVEYEVCRTIMLEGHGLIWVFADSLNSLNTDYIKVLEWVPCEECFT